MQRTNKNERSLNLDLLLRKDDVVLIRVGGRAACQPAGEPRRHECKKHVGNMGPRRKKLPKRTEVLQQVAGNRVSRQRAAKTNCETKQ